jgi:hypothetical protein
MEQRLYAAAHFFLEPGLLTQLYREQRPVRTPRFFSSRRARYIVPALSLLLRD